MMQNKPPRNARRYGGRSPEERLRERRERLMETAFELFTSRGYQNCSVERICLQAKVTTRHFYQQFGNREALLEALLLQLRDEVTELILSAMEKRSDPLQRAHSILQAFVDYYLGDPRRARLGSVESVGISPELEALRRRIIHQLAKFIRITANDLVDAGLLPDRDYHLLAVAMVGAANELIVEWVTSDTGLDADGLSQEIRWIFETLIAGSRRERSIKPNKPDAAELN